MQLENIDRYGEHLKRPISSRGLQEAANNNNDLINGEFQTLEIEVGNIGRNQRAHFGVSRLPVDEQENPDLNKERLQKLFHCDTQRKNRITS